MDTKHTKGEWQAFNMVHADRGDAMTPEEIGEYVKNSVLKSIADGGSADRFLFISTGEEGAPDICLVGNGPNGPANAKLIAAAPELLKECEKQVVWLKHVLTVYGVPETIKIGVEQSIKYLNAVIAKAT